MCLKHTILSLAVATAISGAFIVGVFFGREIQREATVEASVKVETADSYYSSYSPMSETAEARTYSPSYTPK